MVSRHENEMKVPKVVQEAFRIKKKKTKTIFTAGIPRYIPKNILNMQDYVIQPIYCEINDLTFQIEELNIVVVCSFHKEKGMDFVNK